MRGRFTDWLARFFNEPAQQLNLVAPVVQPVVEVVKYGLDHYYLDQQRVFAATVFVASVAAENSVVRLNNPQGSGIMAIVERVRYSTALAAVGTYGVGVTPVFGPLAGLPVAGGMRARDTRVGQLTTTRGACSASGDSLASAGIGTVFGPANLADQHHQAGDPLDLYDPLGLVILGPGSSLDVWEDTVNPGFAIGGFWWRERALDALELSLGS